MLKITDKGVGRVNGDDLQQGHVYRTDNNDIVMVTDEGNVIDLKNGIIFNIEDEGLYELLSAELIIK